MGKRLRPSDRTDGRRKGYKPFKSLIGDRIAHDDPDTFRKLEELRGPVRKYRTKPTHSRPHGKPAAAKA